MKEKRKWRSGLAVRLSSPFLRMGGSYAMMDGSGLSAQLFFCACACVLVTSRRSPRHEDMIIAVLACARPLYAYASRCSQRSLTIVGVMHPPRRRRDSARCSPDGGGCGDGAGGGRAGKAVVERRTWRRRVLAHVRGRAVGAPGCTE